MLTKQVYKIFISVKLNSNLKLALDISMHQVYS